MRLWTSFKGRWVSLDVLKLFTSCAVKSTWIRRYSFIRNSPMQTLKLRTDTDMVKIKKVEIYSAWFHPCTWIRQRILIWKRLFWSVHVAICAVPYGLTDGRVPHCVTCGKIALGSKGNIHELFHHQAATLAPRCNRLLAPVGHVPHCITSCGQILVSGQTEICTIFLSPSSITSSNSCTKV